MYNSNKYHTIFCKTELNAAYNCSSSFHVVFCHSIIISPPFSTCDHLFAVLVHSVKCYWCLGAADRPKAKDSPNQAADRTEREECRGEGESYGKEI